jgi:hypothetical protein
MDSVEVTGSRIASGSARMKSILRVLGIGSAAAFMAKHALSALPRALRISPSDTLYDMLSSQLIELDLELCGLDRTTEFRVLCAL